MIYVLSFEEDVKLWNKNRQLFLDISEGNENTEKMSNLLTPMVINAKTRIKKDKLTYSSRKSFHSTENLYTRKITTMVDISINNFNGENLMESFKISSDTLQKDNPTLLYYHHENEKWK